MCAVSWVARSTEEGLAKAARADEVRVGTVVGSGTAF